jgi:hypothetical protein
MINQTHTVPDAPSDQINTMPDAHRQTDAVRLQTVSFHHSLEARRASLQCCVFIWLNDIVPFMINQTHTVPDALSDQIYAVRRTPCVSTQVVYSIS